MSSTEGLSAGRAFPPHEVSGRLRGSAPRAWLGLVLAIGMAGCVASGSGDTLLQTGRPEAAAAVYAGLDSNAPWLHEKLGLAFLRAGLLSSAERELARARELDPGDPTAVFWLAELAELRGEPSEAAALRGAYSRLRPSEAARVLADPSHADEATLTRAREILRQREVEAVLHPERRRTRSLLRALGPRLHGSGPSTAPTDEWDPRVTDAESWSLGAEGLPEFPPPPGQVR